jgi:hypothetical protein
MIFGMQNVAYFLTVYIVRHATAWLTANISITNSFNVNKTLKTIRLKREDQITSVVQSVCGTESDQMQH